MSEKLKPCPFCGEMDRRVLSVSSSEHWIDGRPFSQVADDSSLPMEGVVARPAVELKNRRGGRVIVKIKARDFA